MEKYPRGGSLNDTAPSLDVIREHLRNYALIGNMQLEQPCWGALQNWLAKELAYYRVFGLEVPTPTEQKKELRAYIKKLKEAEHLFSTDTFLPPAIIGKLHGLEYEQDITHESDYSVYLYILKKRVIAEKVLSEIEAVKAPKGDKKEIQKYQLLASLAAKIVETEPSTKKDDALVAAAYILNDANALGSEHGCFGDSPHRVRKTTISMEPKQIKKQLKKFNLA